ncbi:polysaccharide deacetylase family protein [Paraflavisolibacter sp. H34]|uniref:polysaccharide deacetylase family protein n=1 Tax=Huijunlia imazamoxiresistens TaxID=3127457 RepID=UPI003015CE43
MKPNWKRRLKNLFVNRGLALMYHRIAALPADPWQIAVSPERFSEHLEVLRKYRVVPAGTLVRQLHHRCVASGTVCLTFDDGYGDNYRTARPLLEKHDCPASFFIATAYVDSESEFWWDELARMILEPVELPSQLSLFIGKGLFQFTLDQDRRLTEEQRRRQQGWSWYRAPPTQRCALYLELSERLRALPLFQIQWELKKIRDWAEFSEAPRGDYRPMTRQQLQEMGRHPLFDIGLHTETHPSLPCHSPETQRREITGCGRFLKEQLGRAPRTLAYPYGNFDAATLAIVREQQLQAGFTTCGQTITNRTDPHRIGRFHVRNWNGDEFEKNLSYWASAL